MVGFTSRSIQIRDAIFERITGLTGVYKTLRKTPMPTLQPADLPACSVFIDREDKTSDGSPNIGAIKYIVEATIIIGVMRGFNDPVFMEGGLDDDFLTIEHLLLTDASFTKRGPGGLFEAIPSTSRRWRYEQTGEAYFAEMRLEMPFRFRQMFVPLVPDKLKTIHKDIQVPAGTPPLEEVIELWQPEGDENGGDQGSPV
jgi:hypothetical protein